MKTVLLLGAYSDVGQALAREYAADGYETWLAGRNSEDLKSLQSDLEVRFQASARCFAFDAMALDSHQEFVSELPSIPDITICIFGYLGDQDLGETSWEECHRILGTNYVGAVSILNLLANAYKEKGEGVIVGISSVAGERGRQSNFLYGSAKAGFSAYLAGLRNRLYHHNIHVLSIKPGFINTRMTEHLDLPNALTAQPDQVARSIKKAVRKKKNQIYVLWMWRWIMWIIRNIPESIFKKMKM